jgi:hypothetical protein
MCLRFQFFTHQRVCILYFLKKKSNSLYPIAECRFLLFVLLQFYLLCINCRLGVPCWLLSFIFSFLFPISYFPLPTFHFLLPTSYFLFPLFPISYFLYFLLVAGYGNGWAVRETSPRCTTR